MQVSTFMTDLIEFKDEIFKKVRLLENKVMTEVNNKYLQINANYEKLDNKVSFISENNDSLLELITTQKFNSDKVSELENFKNKTEQSMIMYDLKLKTLSSEIDKIKLKYDKAIVDNLQVSGYIGPGCQFKTISEYISNNIFEFSKLKNEKEQMKIENTEIKTRLDNILKSTLNLIDSSIVRCQKYSDNKHKDMQKILDNKLIEIKEKNMDIRTQISKYEIQNEKQIENLKNNIQQLMMMKNELLTLTGQKIEEVKKKIETMENEVNILSKIKEKENISNTNDNVKMKNNSNYKSGEDIKANINNNNIKKNSYRLKKNFMNTNSTISEQPKSNKYDYNNDIIKQNQNKENILEEDYNFEKIFPRNFKTISEYQRELNGDNRIIEKNNILNKEEKINNIKEMDDSSKNVLEGQKKNDTNINSINKNVKIEDIKDLTYLFKNKKNFNTKKIEIESLEKQKSILSNSSINISDFKNQKKEVEKDKFKTVLNINKNISMTVEEKVKTLPVSKNYSKINVINRLNNKKVDNLCISPKGYNIKQNFISYNEEQNQIMNEIKTFYNQRKEKYEQKSQENIIDCNIINLHLDKPPKVIREKNISAKNSRHFSKDSKIRNNISEIGMKITPAFGRTTYSFYNKKDINVNINNNGMQNRKINSLKDRINMAFVSSIKQKIGLNDKAISFQ